jgi:hypothetical protein
MGVDEDDFMKLLLVKGKRLEKIAESRTKSCKILPHKGSSHHTSGKRTVPRSDIRV